MIKISSSIIKNDDLNTIYFISLLLLPTFFRQFINILLAPAFDIFKKIKSKSKSKYKNENYNPFVTVMIPAWNEEVGITNTIKSVMNNSYQNKEVLIINDGSSDKTEEVTQKTFKELANPQNLKYIYKKNGGKATALNLGLKKAKGEIIITVDADSFMHKHAIQEWVNSFKDPSIKSVAGNVKIGNKQKFIGIAQAIEYLWGFYFRKADALMNSLYIVGGAAAAYRREMFELLGDFDEDTITEDLEMSVRILNAGYKISYAPEALVFTEGPSEVKGLIKQRFRWKRGRFEVFLKYYKLFFNPSKNLYLSMFVLPLALLSEIVLFFEWLILVSLYSYIIISGYFLSLIIGLLIVTLTSIIIINNKLENNKFKLMLCAPFTLFLIYFIDFIEYQAQLKTIWSFIRKKEVKWQKWQRVGVFSQN